MSDYSDIINTSWPKPSMRGRMNLKQRAKIFLPFAALTGFEESLALTRKNYDIKPHLNSDEIEDINYELEKLSKYLEDGITPEAKLTFFKEEAAADKGFILEKKLSIVKIHLGENFKKSFITGKEKDGEEITVFFENVVKITVYET